MATIATPRRPVRWGRRSLIIGAVVLLLIIVAASLMLRGTTATSAPTATPGWQTAAAQTGVIDAAVNATGSIEPQAQAELRFAVDGTVTAVLVKPGDAIQAGQPLARIDTTDLNLALDKAMSDLKQAQADAQELHEGATPAQLAEAQAHVAQAQGQYQQAVGSVTAADIAAARAKIEQAQARLARLQSGAATDERASADARLQQAQSALEQSRSQLSSAKEQARLAMATAANTLRNMQDAYSRIYWDNRKLESTYAKFGKSLPQENQDQEAAALRDVNDADAALQQARIAYEDAQQQEITTLQTREADVRSAQADRDNVLAGPRSDELAEARATLQAAQAELARLTGANRSGNVAASQAGIEMAQAELAKLNADPSASALTRAEAAVARAEVAVKQAQRAIEQATLTAPFAATVARIDLRVGEPTGQSAVVAIADLRSFHVDVPVDELDVAQLRAGQQVRIALDALPNKDIVGSVTNVEPLAIKTDKGTTNYKVTVAITSSDPAIRPGMTATVQIITVKKDQAILVPRRAVLLDNGKSYVFIPAAGQPDPKTHVPAHERREVVIGLSNNDVIEITSGLKAGETVLVPDVVNTVDVDIKGNN